MAKILRKIIDNSVIVAIDGDVVGTETAKLYGLAVKAIPDDSELVVMDMSRVDFMDSRGIGFMIKLYRKLLSQGKGVGLSSLSPMVAQTFERTRVDTIFQIFLTNEDVLKRYKPLIVSVDQTDPDTNTYSLKGIINDAAVKNLTSNLDMALKHSSKNVALEIMDVWYASPQALDAMATWLESMVKQDRRAMLVGEEHNTSVFTAHPTLRDLFDIRKPSESNRRKEVATKIEPHRNGEYAVIKIQGELKGINVDEFASAASPAALRRPKGLVLDLSTTTDIDSRGVGAIMKTINDMKLFSARIAMVSPNPRIGRVLNITGISRFINEFRTEKDAVAGLDDLGPLRT